MTWRPLWEHLEDTARDWSRHGLHFVDRHQDVTYPELAHRVRRCAGAFVDAGLAVGDSIGLLLPTSAEFYIALLGAQRAGLAPSPFAPPTSVTRLAEDARVYARALRAGRCRALVVDQTMIARMGAALDELGVPILQIERLESAEPSHAELPRVLDDPRAFALVQYTSGSTSHPKGVALTHAQLAAGIQALVTGAEIGPRDVNGQWLPVHHDMGLIGSLTGLAAGVDQYLWSPMTFVRSPAKWLGQFAARKATIYAGPSFSYRELAARCDEQQLAELDLSAWRIAFNGSEHVDANVLRSFVARFTRCGLRPEVVLPVYGLAEATLAVTIPRLRGTWHARRVDPARLGPGAEVAATEHTGREVVSVGRPIAEHRIRIMLDGKALPEGHVGEIQLNGPAVMTEYYQDPAATAETFEDGWLRTGDLGFLADGELYITGRIKEMMILHGRNVYPDDVEEVVQHLPGCHRGMAVAFAGDDEAGEYLVLLAETRLSDPAACADLALASQRAVRTALSIPRLEVVLVRPGAIPRTTSGKRQRLLVKARLQQRELRDAVVWSTSAAVSNPGAPP